MKQLNCLTWDQVIEKYSITSSYKALLEYFIAFKDWVSIVCVEITEYILLQKIDKYVWASFFVVLHRNHVAARKLVKSKIFTISQLPFLPILKERVKKRTSA